MVEPVPCLSSSDQSAQLVDLYPDDVFNELVAPLLKAVDADVECSACDPEEDQATFVLQMLNSCKARCQLFVFDCLVG